MTPTECFQHLHGFKGKQYEIHKHGLPDAVRKNISVLCESFENSSYDVREQIVSLAVREISFLFFVFSEAMAIAAVQHEDKHSVIRGLEALAIENCIADWRDSLLRLVLLYHSAVKIYADPEKLIGEVANLAMKTAQEKLFYPFLARTPEDRQLAKFGVKEGKTPNGEFAYVTVD